LEVIEKVNSLDLPYPLLIEIAPEGTANNVLTLAWFILIEVVPDNPNSTLTLLREMAPDAGNVIWHLTPKV
jgi:hypothetical protein